MSARSARLSARLPILEGSVRSDGKQIRVNVQLINAENDEHIWANEYDRKLTDVFQIQSRSRAEDSR